MTTDPTREALKIAILRNFMAASLTAQALMTRPSAAHPSQPFELAVMRLGRAMADMSLALARLDVLAEPLPVMAPEDWALDGDGDIPMPVPANDTATPPELKPAENRHCRDIPIAAEAPPPRDIDIPMPVTDVRSALPPSARRRRGAQPGNRNRQTHGFRTREARKARARRRAIVADARRLKSLATDAAAFAGASALRA